MRKGQLVDTSKTVKLAFGKTGSACEYSDLYFRKPAVGQETFFDSSFLITGIKKDSGKEYLIDVADEFFEGYGAFKRLVRRSVKSFERTLS